MKDIETIYGNRVRLRVCGIAIHQNKLLLVRHEGLGESGQLWSFPGGGLEFGEDLKSGLIREFKEETNLDIEVMEQLFIYEFIKTPLHAVEIYFRVRICDGSLQTGHDPELEEDVQHLKEARFVTFDELEVMKSGTKHEILQRVHDKEALLNLSGYFKF